jgi:uncharacterized protein DUF882
MLRPNCSGKPAQVQSSPLPKRTKHSTINTCVDCCVSPALCSASPYWHKARTWELQPTSCACSILTLASGWTWSTGWAISTFRKLSTSWITFCANHRTGDIHHYDPRLFDLLSDLTASVGRASAELHVICGYRSPWSNEFLRTHTVGVAQHSLQMEAEAIDVRLPGLNTSAFRDAALALHRGGVGYYAKSDFIHVDVGRVRRW